IQFRVSHLGFSWLYGRFNQVDGSFTYDEAKPDESSVEVNIDVNSIDSIHAEREKHLRSKDYLNVDEYPTAKFVSTSFKDLGDGKAEMKGNLTLHGVTKEITMDVSHVGGGKSPWGDYRQGFHGTTTLKLEDFGMK